MKHAVKLIHFVGGPRVPTKNLVVREGCT